jgi:hypothetical protein
MSINIYTEPNAISTPYRPCFVDASSDDATIVRMIADIYVNGALKATIDKDPILGTTNTFRFEIGDVLKKYVVPEWHTVSSSPQSWDDLTSAAAYYIRTFEVLDNGTTLDTSWSEAGAGTSYVQSSTLNTFNGVNQHEQTFSEYIAAGNTDNLLTNRPNNSKAVNTSLLTFGILTEAASANLKVIEKDGVNGTGSTLATNSSPLTPPSYGKLSFGVDTSGLNASTKSIVLQAFDSDPAAITQTLTINIVASCGEETILHWQNHWGEYDTYYFIGRKTEKTKTKTKTIDNRLDLAYNLYDRGKKDLTKSNVREFEMYTQAESPTDIAWLAEIGESPDVFIMSGTDRIPINVKSVTRTIIDDDKLIKQISIKYVMSNPRINQDG